MKIAFLLSFLLFFNTLQLCGQDYNYTHYTTKDGLPSETVYTITQDRAGFLWFAGETGLSRFDGRKFKTFTVADGLPSNEVFGCYEDDCRRLWIKSFSNQVCFYKDGKIHNKQNDSLLSHMSFSGEIEEILGSKRKDVIIYDRNTNIVVLDSNNKTTKYGEQGFSMAYELMHEQRWIQSPLLLLPNALNTGILKYMSPGLAFKIYKGHDYAFIILSNAIAIPKDSVAVWDYRKGAFIAILDFFPSFSDGDKVLGFRRNGGACIYDLRCKREIAVFLPEYIVNNVYKDRENNLWFSTKENGIFKLNSSRPVNYNISNKASSVRFIHKAREGIFIGVNNEGLWKVDEIKEPYTDKISVGRKVRIKGGIDWLKEQSDLYINYTGGDFLDLKKWNKRIKSIYAFNDTVLLSTSAGAFISGLQNSTPGSFRSIFGDRATCAIKQQGFYYIGTLYGLFILDAGFHIIAQPLSCRISHFAKGSDGSLWIAAYDRGIFRLKNNKLIDSINEGNAAISSNVCRCIFLSGNELWAGTDKGLNRIRITDSGCRVTAIYTASNRLNSNTINAIWVTDATVYAGTSKGLCTFNRYLDPGKPMFNLEITGISVSGKDLAWDEEPVLDHDNNDIKFDFSAISFSLEHISYRYHLSGLTGHWEQTTEPSLNFFSLPSGVYELQVQAIDQMGNRSPVVRKTFRVRMAIYEYWWFRALIVLCVFGLMFLFFQFRIKKIRKTETEKSAVSKQIAGLEQMALRAQMNPHFIFNCLNSIQSYILKGDIVGANFYLTEFGNLVRQTLENAPKLYIPLSEEIAYLRHYIELERLQINRPFDYVIHIEPDLLDLPFPNMILQPYVENAIKHGLNKREGKGYLSIEFDRSAADMLTCIIQDDGPGIDTVSNNSNKAHSSKGMSLTQKRIETLNLLANEVKDITVVVTDLRHTGKRGTMVKISLQIITTHKK